MFDYHRAMARINEKQDKISEELEKLTTIYHARERKLEYKLLKNYLRICIISDIKHTGITPKKKPKLTTKHPENVETRVNILTSNIFDIQEKLKSNSILRHSNVIHKYVKNSMDNFNIEDYLKTNNIEKHLEKSLHNHITKLNRYQQILNKNNTLN